MNAKPASPLLLLPLAMLLASCGGSSGGGRAASPPGVTPATGALDARPANLTCLAPPLTGGTTAIALTRVFPNLGFSQPLAMLQAPGDATRWFVLEKTGRVQVFANDPAVTAASEFLDLTDFVSVETSGEGGLLGMAFHPDFANNGQVFLSWTEGPPMVSVVARFTSINGGLTLDPGSQQTVLRLRQDFSNHNGGHIAFDGNGLLYVGFGDGGSGGDPNSRAQDTTNLLGSMLRLDVDSGLPYAVPGDNPFAGNALCTEDPNISLNACPEIYAWGLRNPWRYSFDSATDALWVGDVGQNAREEIDIVALGGNYGWDCREGFSGFGSPAPSCSAATGLIDPVHDYPRSLGASITGGYVYRGSALPGLAGSYLFGDYVSGRIWRLVGDGLGGYTDEELLDSNESIASFGEDINGELYVVNIASGALFRIDAVGGSGTGPPVPTRLSATGCVDPASPTEPASGLIPYTVVAPFWSDGADKTRWLALPNGTTISVTGDGDFVLPPGAVAMKHFRLGTRLIETRLLMHHPGGDWAGYTYAWDANETDANLVQGGRIDLINGQDWIFPSGAECDACHTAAAGFSLGLETAQLNNDLMYPATGRTANQLLSLNAVGVFANTIGDPAALQALVNPADPGALLTARARAYLHTNCAQCHRPGGPTPSDMDLRFTTLLDATLACDVVPQAGDLGLGTNARIIAPGDAALSVLIARMARRDANAMPPLGSSTMDAAGIQLVSNWINSLATCL